MVMPIIVMKIGEWSVEVLVQILVRPDWATRQGCWVGVGGGHVQQRVPTASQWGFAQDDSHTRGWISLVAPIITAAVHV